MPFGKEPLTGIVLGMFAENCGSRAARAGVASSRLNGKPAGRPTVLFCAPLVTWRPKGRVPSTGSWFGRVKLNWRASRPRLNGKPAGRPTVLFCAPCVTVRPNGRVPWTGSWLGRVKLNWRASMLPSSRLNGKSVALRSLVTMLPEGV